MRRTFFKYVGGGAIGVHKNLRWVAQRWRGGGIIWTGEGRGVGAFMSILNIWPSHRSVANAAPVMVFRRALSRVSREITSKP